MATYVTTDPWSQPFVPWDYCAYLGYTYKSAAFIWRKRELEAIDNWQRMGTVRNEAPNMTQVKWGAVTLEVDIAARRSEIEATYATGIAQVEAKVAACRAAG